MQQILRILLPSSTATGGDKQSAVLHRTAVQFRVNLRARNAMQMKAGWSSQWCQLWCLLGALVCAGVCAAKPRILEIQIMFSARLLPALPPFLARLHKITSKFGKTINTLTLSDDVFPSQFLTAPIGSSSSDEATFCCVLCVLVE